MGTTQNPDALTKKRIQQSAIPIPEVRYAILGTPISLVPIIAEVDGKDAYVVELSGEGRSTQEYFDAETGLKLKTVIHSASGPQTTSYGDYREVNGLKFPYLITVSSQVDIVFKVTDLKVNSGLKDDEFR
jgi:hypothetical protein